jgi:plasmid stabilization system protein ParE
MRRTMSRPDDHGITEPRDELAAGNYVIFYQLAPGGIDALRVLSGFRGIPRASEDDY